jgi:hypothetical protein
VSTRGTALGVLGSPSVQHVVRHYSPSHIGRGVLGSRGIQRVVRSYGGGRAAGRVLRSRRIRRVVQQYQPQLHSQLQAPVALPNAFTSRIGPLGFAPFQRAATSAVETAVHALPGRVRAPIFPQTPGVRTAAQQNLIDLATTRYVHRAAAERGYQARGQGMAPLQRSLMRSDPQARRALSAFFGGRGSTLRWAEGRSTTGRQGCGAGTRIPVRCRR